MYEIKRSEKEIDDVIHKAAKQEEEGKSLWPGMTYEQGVKNSIFWLVSHYFDNPMPEE